MASLNTDVFTLRPINDEIKSEIQKLAYHWVNTSIEPPALRKTYYLMIDNNKLNDIKPFRYLFCLWLLNRKYIYVSSDVDPFIYPLLSWIQIDYTIYIPEFIDQWRADDIHFINYLMLFEKSNIIS